MFCNMKVNLNRTAACLNLEKAYFEKSNFNKDAHHLQYSVLLLLWLNNSSLKYMFWPQNLDLHLPNDILVICSSAQP